jgi:hypothetical protein
MNVTQEQAYAEACQALGEAVVAQRLIAKEVARLTAELERLRAPVEGPLATDPLSDDDAAEESSRHGQPRRQR